jgi:hypothetical protein
MTELELEVQDGDITIWLPETSYTVTYYKPKNSPQLRSAGCYDRG